MALPKVSFALVAGSLLAAAAPSIASAQKQNITIDGRFSPAQTLTGPNYSIGADLGKQVGGNLFHSFGKFGLATGESATFSGPATVNNVIGRVTGGARSDIDGKIQSNIAGANLFLINPGGIVFGPNAAVNVSGAFHASTADYIKMADGAKFQATHPDGSTLSAAPPAAFGFLTASPARISVNGSQLNVLPGQTLGLVGGPVSITPATPTSTSGANLSAPGGTIHVTGAAGNGEVPVDPRNTSALTVSSFGPLEIKGTIKGRSTRPDSDDGKSILNVENAGSAALGPGGSVFVRAGVLSLDAGAIEASNYGSGPGGLISLRGDSQVTLGGRSLVQALALGAGSGGEVRISTAPEGNISISTPNGGNPDPDFNTRVQTGSSTVIGTSPELLGPSGSLSMQTGQLRADRSLIQSNTEGFGSGGLISLRADKQISLSGGTLVQSVTAGRGNGGGISISTAPGGVIAAADDTIVAVASTGAGYAGPLSVDTDTGQLVLTNGAQFASVVQGSGNAPPATFTAGSVIIDGRGNQNHPTAIGSRTGDRPPGPRGTGTGADVSLTIGTGGITILGNGEVASTTWGPGNAGNLSVDVLGGISIDGTAATVFTGITSVANPGSTGKAGSLAVNAASLTIANGSSIQASTGGSGPGGDLTINVVGDLVVSGGATPSVFKSGISSQALEGSAGHAGRVAVIAGNISILNGAVVSSSTSGAGAAGEVAVEADSLTVKGGGQIASSTAGPGKGGDVAVTVASDISMSDPGPQITAQSSGSGNAGSITVSAVRLLMDDRAAISTAAEKADGGNITLDVRDLLYLTNSKITTSVNTENGNGGNITIDPQLMILNHSSIIAQAAEGRGGNIRINAGAFIQSADSSVDASSETGISGTVVITGPRVDVNGALVVLSSELRGRAAVLREACAAYGDRPVSSLVEAGRGGLPQDPETTLPALYIADRDLSPNPAAGDKTEANSAPLQTTVRLTMHCG